MTPRAPRIKALLPLERLMELLATLPVPARVPTLLVAVFKEAVPAAPRSRVRVPAEFVVMVPAAVWMMLPDLGERFTL